MFRDRSIFNRNVNQPFYCTNAVGICHSPLANALRLSTLVARGAAHETAGRRKPSAPTPTAAWLKPSARNAAARATGAIRADGQPCMAHGALFQPGRSSREPDARGVGSGAADVPGEEHADRDAARAIGGRGAARCRPGREASRSRLVPHRLSRAVVGGFTQRRRLRLVSRQVPAQFGAHPLRGVAAVHFGRGRKSH